MSKIYVTDAYHHSTLKPSQVGAFAYLVQSVPDGDVILIFINLVLPMGWVDPPKFFCSFSETLTDVENTLVNADLPVPTYRVISALPATEPPPPQHPGEPHPYILLYGWRHFRGAGGGGRATKPSL